jgi:hypothetical protein
MSEPLPRRVSQIFDLGTAGGEWTFKQDEMLFGPLPARQIIEKMYAGELSGETLVSPSDQEGAFSRLREVPFFAVHVAKAEAKLRVKRDSDEFKTKEALGFRLRTAVVVGLILGTLGLAGGGAYTLVIDRHQRLQREIDEIPITANPPELSATEGSAAGDSEVSVPAPGTAAAPGAARRARRSGAMEATAGHPGGGDGLAAINFDKNSIIGAEVRQKSQLIPCIKQELQRTPTFRGDIRFTVAVGNEGKVAKLWMDDSQFKEGPLQQCFWQRMSGWRFASYEGERATLSDSFRVGR